MKEGQGLVFDIQSFSVHDGPGSRTLVFLSGCPLRCQWCSNPEGLELRQRFLFSQAKCKYDKTNCKRCLKACPYGAISPNGDGKLHFNMDLCDKCPTHDCVDRCIYEAARLSGKVMTEDDVMKAILRDSQFWSQGGGVTFSGGEATMQKDFLLRLLKSCKKNSVHRAIETTAFTNTKDFLEIFSLIDFALIDCKHMDSAQHKAKTGVSNELILHNISTLANSGWKGRLVLRIPIIEGFNDSEQNIMNVIGFMNANKLFEVNILPFHRLGDSKWSQLGRSYPYKEYEPTPKDKMRAIQDIFLDHGVACYVDEELA
jgi:pyruvate formate lyase activating enzyme